MPRLQNPCSAASVSEYRAAISPAMALRIERWLGRDHGGAAEVWIAQQAAYDLWQARQVAKETNALAAVKALKLQIA